MTTRTSGKMPWGNRAVRVFAAAGASLIVATCLAALLECFLVRPWSSGAFFLRPLILFFPAFLLLLHAAFAADVVWSAIDRNRYALAAGVLAFAVMFNLNGSSIAFWNRYVPNKRAEAPLFGIERDIRSDEWAVFTPMTLAQSLAKPAWPYFNDIPRAAPTDMFSVYAQPVRHPLLVFRPFLAGHVLFGFRHGLAFFWVGRWLALLLVAYELFKLLTAGDKPLSGAAAALVMFAPAVQWWGAVNALVEIMVSGSLFVLCLDRFMRESSLRTRWLPIVGMGYSAVAYAMALYPAAQVPFAYVFGALALWTVLRRAKGFRADSATWLFAGVVVLAAAGFLAWYLRLSSEAFRITAGTEYPGRRFSCGGGGGRKLGASWGNLFFPWTSSTVENSNSFELAVFLDFFPLGIMLAAFLFLRRKVCDLPSLLLVAACVLLGVYAISGLPRWAAAATQLSRSTDARALVAFSFAQFLLLIRVISLLRPSPRVPFAALAAVVFAGLSTLLAHRSYPTYLSLAHLAAVFAVSASGGFLWLRFFHHRLLAPAFAVVLAILGGAFVNPIQRGDAGVRMSNLARKIRSVVESDGGTWLVDAETFPMNQYPLLAGAPTVNSVNSYPVRERWMEIDPDGKAMDVWNRYACSMRLDVNPEGKPIFRLLQPDSFQVDLPMSVLRRWNVRWVLSRRNLGEMAGDGLRLRQMARASEWRIFVVETSP
jgi:hypothetical protein